VVEPGTNVTIFVTFSPKIWQKKKL
jgi:hypothetical protein